MIIKDIAYRELHLLMDEWSVRAYTSANETVHTTYLETKKAVCSQTPLIFTTIPHFLNWDYATRLFVHFNGEQHEITIGECEGTKRVICDNHNIEKLLLACEFDWWCD